MRTEAVIRPVPRTRKRRNDDGAVDSGQLRPGPVDRLDALLQRVTPDLVTAVTPGLVTSGLVTPDALWDDIVQDCVGWAWVRDTYALDDRELDVLLLALAPELDGRYARMLSRLQDDVAACRPSVGLILQVLSASFPGPPARELFQGDASLLGSRLVTLVGDPRLIAPPLSAHFVVIDDQIADVLLQLGGLDRQVAAVGRLTRTDPGAWDPASPDSRSPNSKSSDSKTSDSKTWSQVPLPASERARLLALATSAVGRRPFRLHLEGPPGSGRRVTATALAAELGRPLLHLDLGRLDVALLARAVREAVLHDAVLYLDGADALAEDSELAAGFGAVLAAHPGVVLLAGTRPWAAAAGALPGVVRIPMGRPAFGERRNAWRRELAAAGVDPAPADELAARFHCGPGTIADAVATAVTATAGSPGRDELFTAARSRGAHHLANLARRVEPAYGWADLVLPDESTTSLTDLCRRVTLGRKVWHEWGFERKIAHGRGTTALFAGPSGTGKTMAAEVVAREIGLDLFTVDLSGVISKYIGETEKNLERIFTAATEADAILMFDEADALFGKRSQVRDAHDRYANVETAYLLQRMERYEGVAILATNLRSHLDEAFTRRLQFIVDFPFPDEEHRRRLWTVCWPEAAPREATLDLDALARDVRLAGGNIRNVALHAAFLAAADGCAIRQDHVLRAVAHEYRKLGRIPPDQAG